MDRFPTWTPKASGILNWRNSSPCHWDWNRNFRLPGKHEVGDGWRSLSVQTTIIDIRDLKFLLGLNLHDISSPNLKICYPHDIPLLAFAVSFLKPFDHHTIPLPHLGPRGRHFASHGPLESWKSRVLDISIADSRSDWWVNECQLAP